MLPHQKCPLEMLERPTRFILFRYEVAVALAMVRRLSGRARDWLTLIVLVPLLAFIARAWLAALPDGLRDLVAFGAALSIATLLSKALIERIRFHRVDGVLARDAQRPRDGVNYFVPLLFAGIVSGLASLVVLDLADPRNLLLGLCSGLPVGLLLPFVQERVRRWWRRIGPKRLECLAQSRFAMAAAAALSVMCASLVVALPSANHLDTIIVGAFGLTVILLTAPVSDEIVRYMTLMGHTSLSLLRYWLPIQLALLWPLALVLLAAQAWTPATVATLVSLALPIVTALRILAYRAFSRLIADWAVAVVILAAVYAAFTVSPLAPAIIIAAVIWLARRGAGARWLLA